jgi:hypothetical protein
MIPWIQEIRTYYSIIRKVVMYELL